MESHHPSTEKTTMSLGVVGSEGEFFFKRDEDAANVSRYTKNEGNGIQIICQNICQVLIGMLQTSTNPKVSQMMPTVTSKQLNLILGYAILPASLLDSFI